MWRNILNRSIKKREPARRFLRFPPKEPVGLRSGAEIKLPPIHCVGSDNFNQARAPQGYFLYITNPGPRQQAALLAEDRLELLREDFDYLLMGGGNLVIGQRLVAGGIAQAEGQALLAGLHLGALVKVEQLHPLEQRLA